MSVVPERYRAAVDALLDRLDPTQRDAVTSAAAPLAILAGAGSGKTRVLTRRIAWMAAEERLDPAHTLAVTFTRKAAGELRSRLARLGVREGVTAGTFHSIALAQLRRRVAEQGKAMPTLLERKVRLLIPIVGGRGREATLAAQELASEIEWAKARLVTPDTYERTITIAGRTPPRAAPEVARVFAAYEKEKRRRGLADFDDLISGCANAMERDPEFGAAQRWRFRHLFVDELQDASPSQWRLLRAWLGDRAELTAVGDPDQAIYAFAGADPGYLERFRMYFAPEHYPDAGVVRLGSNYRSTPQIVIASAAVLPGRRPPVRAPRADGPAPTVTEYDSDTDEARGIARALRRAQGPSLPWSRMAVLYRVNAQSALFEEALSRAGVPFRVRGGERFLDRAEVKVALDELRARGREHPGRTFADHLADFTTDADELSEERREHLDALARLGEEYLESEPGLGTVDGYLAFLQEALRGDDTLDSAGDGSGGVVELLTFHRAKGLEFDTVFVAGLERGLVPISHAKTDDALAEEQRLLYVALSRAERELHLSWAKRRTVGSRANNRTPSPWLARVQRAIAGVTEPEPGDGSDARSSIAAARDKVARGKGASKRSRSAPELSPDDAPLYEALVEWRLRQSRAASAPAYVIFDNATLAAIAAARPRDPASLLEVPGIGPVKAERYGEAVLALVGEHSG
jgi:DNA helicase-2/ATP-dependent DNA helicase PcrA